MRIYIHATPWVATLEGPKPFEHTCWPYHLTLVNSSRLCLLQILGNAAKVQPKGGRRERSFMYVCMWHAHDSSSFCRLVLWLFGSVLQFLPP